MSDPELGWAWFETNAPSVEHEQPPHDSELAHVYARCFRGDDGAKVLNHLKSITYSRILGPAAPDALLRHMEGQRQLVSHIISLAEHGRSQCRLGDAYPVRNGSETMEIMDD